MLFISSYCIWHIFHGGFIFANLVLFANLTRRNIYLRSRRMNATCVCNTIVVQYTVHMQGRIANFAFWKWVNDEYWFLRPLLSSIANLTTRENVWKSRFVKNYTREIYGVYSTQIWLLFAVAQYIQTQTNRQILLSFLSLCEGLLSLLLLLQSFRSPPVVSGVPSWTSCQYPSLDACIHSSVR